MRARLSVLMITKNADALLEKSLVSVNGIADEIVIIDDFSTDRTVEIAKRFQARIFEHRQKTLGLQREYGLSRCSNMWVLMLDADELLTEELKKEITEALSQDPRVAGYRIPYRNHFLGHELRYGGEAYSVLRLFRRDKTRIISDQIHEHAEVDGTVENLRSPILHYSYQSIAQTYTKFAYYAKNEAVRKQLQGETAGYWKLFTYPVHMFLSRFIKDQGYRDHFSRILLDFGFAYMEFLTYFFMLFPEKKGKKD